MAVIPIGRIIFLSPVLDVLRRPISTVFPLAKLDSEILCRYILSYERWTYFTLGFNKVFQVVSG